ncbi:hypothetical protein MNB_ARC-1_802 [hydrothermal vent metagenome]|uniref:Uncharacterized protein n=1 Tax=hydrothermal vent metagenome TaxID=652676 RepID=A0A3B1E778_9ZZZZ
MISDTISLMMIVSAFISITMLILVLVFAKKSYFQDPSKSSEYPLFDSVNDLQDAIKKDKNKK